MFHKWPPERDYAAEQSKREALKQSRAAHLDDRAAFDDACVRWAFGEERAHAAGVDGACAGAARDYARAVREKAQVQRGNAEYQRDWETRTQRNLEQHRAREELAARTAAVDIYKAVEADVVARESKRVAHVRGIAQFRKARSEALAAQAAQMHAARAACEAHPPTFNTFEERPKNPPQTEADLEKDRFLHRRAAEDAKAHARREKEEADRNLVHADAQQRNREREVWAQRVAKQRQERECAAANQAATAAKAAEAKRLRMSEAAHREAAAAELAERDRLDGVNDTERARRRAAHVRELNTIVADRRAELAAERARTLELERRDAERMAARQQILEEQKAALEKQYQALMRARRPQTASVRGRGH